MMLCPRIAISPISSVPSIVFHESSISFTSTPQIGMPIEPGRGSLFGSLNVATGDVSDRPYPSRIWTPKRSLTSLMISTGRLDPPATARRRLPAIRCTSTPSVSALSSPQYMVGTPAKNVMSSFSSSLTAAAASKRGSNTSVDAVAKPAFMLTVEPNEWNSGNTSRCVSVPGLDWNSRLQVSALSSRFECDSSAPLAWPVVPLV